MKFKKSKTSKVVSGFVGLATALMMMGPAVASAATIEELTAQINALLAQVQALQAAQSSSSMVASGHVFSADLTVGSKGDDVTALQTVLVSKGHLVMPSGVAMGYFGNLTKAAVAAWQAASGISPAAGYVGPKSRAALNGGSMTTTTTTTTTTTSTSLPVGCTSNVGYSPVNGQSCATAGTVTATGAGVSAMLDASSPAAGTLIAGQAVATLAVFKITNAGSASAKVTSLKFKRTGISSDTTLTNIYLYEGTMRITDAASVTQGVVNFNDSAGIVTVAAGASALVVVRADVAAGTNGQNVGIMLTDVTADAGAVGGLPVSGAQHAIAALPTGSTGVDFSATVVPSAIANVDPQTDFQAYRTTVTINNRDGSMSSFRLRQIGSVSKGDLKNFRMFVDGVQVGSAIDDVDAGGYVTFAFPTPITLKTGNREFKVLVDIIAGSNRTFELSLRQAGDVEIADSQLGFTVLPLVAAAAFSAPATFTQTINQGTLSITKATDSKSGNVVNQGSGLALGKFTLKAQGEKLKIENLRISFTPSDAGGVIANDSTKLRNGALFANGVQIGSTADICADDATSGGAVCATNYTQFNLGSALIVEPGKDVSLEVRGDVFDNDGTNNMGSGDTFTVNVVAGSSNIQRLVSLSYIANTAVSANTLTVAAGTLTLAKYSAYANQTVTVPKTAYKIGDFRLTSGSTEAVNLTSFNIDASALMTASGAHVTDVYVVYGDKTGQLKSTMASSSNTWSLNESFAVNASMSIAVYATLSTSIPADSLIIVDLTVNGTSQNSGSAVASSEVVGQTITVGTGSLTTARDASSPGTANVVGNSTPKVASFKYSSSNDTFTLKEIGVTTSAAGATAIQNLIFKDGDTTIATVPMNVTAATATGLSVAVPYNGTKLIDVYAQLGAIGTGFATSSADVAVTLSSTKYLNSSGSTLWENTARAGLSQYVFKTRPVFTQVALPTSVIQTGTNVVAQFKITADAGGTVSWSKLVMNFSKAGTGATTNLLTVNIYDTASPSTALASVTVATSTTQFTITSTVDQEIPAGGSKTYRVDATFLGGATAGDSFSTSIPNTGVTAAPDTSAAAALVATNTFVWSDESLVGHALTTSDWVGDYLLNIPTASQAVSR